MALLLEMAGHRVVEARDGAAALVALAVTPEITLVVTDLAMPVMDGWELLAEFRRRGHAQPVIVLSATLRYGRALPGWVRAVFVKPADPEEILTAVSACAVSGDPEPLVACAE